MPVHELRGAAFMALAMACFSINDAFTKLTFGDLNAAQVMSVRSVFAAAILGLLAWRQGHAGAARALLHPLVGLRIAGEIGGTLCYLLAIATIPLSAASSIFQALPIAVAVGAVLVFGERIGARGYASIVFAFLGVLVIVRPGVAVFDPNAAWALLAVLFCAVRDLATARIPASIGAGPISAATSVALAVAGALLAHPLGGWAAMDLRQTMMLFAAAVAVVAGYLFLITALRSGRTGLVSMFRYSYLLFTMLLAIAVFGETLDGPTVAGAAMIVAAGIMLMRGKQV